MQKKFFKHIINVNIIIACVISLYIVAKDSIEFIPQQIIQSDYALNDSLKEEIKQASSKYNPAGYRYDVPPILESCTQYMHDDVSVVACIFPT